MKTLYLLRHAKSSPGGRTKRDFDRPLNERGVRSCDLIAQFFAENNIRPGIILCSSAARARETGERITRHAGWPDDTGCPKMDFREELYLAEPRIILSAAHSLDDSFDSALIIGHNPGLEETAKALAGGGDESARQSLQKRYPTGALTILVFDIASWREAVPGKGLLRGFIRPRELEKS